MNLYENYTPASILTSMDVNVNHPKHYQLSNGLETIDIIQAVTEEMNGFEAVCVGNAMKYIIRHQKKNGVEDIKKAIWYLNKLIEVYEEYNSKS